MGGWFSGEKSWEGIFLVVFVGILLWMSLGPIMQYRLVHDNPVGFGAGDSYLWFAHSQYVHDSGSFRFNPPFLQFYLEKISSPLPPLFIQLTAYLSYALGVPVYDAQVLLAILSVVFAILIFFIMVRDYNPVIAYLSLPLAVFSFTFPFVSGLVFGFLPALFGFLFLFSGLFMLLHMELKYSAVVLGVFISAIIMAHPFRVFELFLFGSLIIILGLLFRTLHLSVFKKVFVACLLAFIASFYYLSVFKQRFVEEGAASLSYGSQSSANYLGISLGSFEFVKYVIVAGLVLCLFLLVRDRKNIHALVFALPITTVLSVYIFKVDRVYQITFLWPVILSLAFGVVLFFLLKLKWFVRFDKKPVYFVLSLAITLLFISQYYYYFRAPVLESISESGITTTKNQWDNLVWVSENTEPGSNVLFFYFNDNPSDIPTLLWSSKRASFYIPLDKLDLAISEKVIREDYGVLDTAEPYFYRRDPNFPLRIFSLDKGLYSKNWSVCDFDYIYGKRAVYVVDVENKQMVDKKVQSRVLYAMDVFNLLLKRDNFRVVHQSDEAVIIKNLKPGVSCLV